MIINIKVRRPTGQVVFEYALSLIGIVIFFGVILKVWVWTNANIVRRQHSFQTTRVLAGTSGSRAGSPVPFVEPKIELFKSAGSVGGGVPPPGDPAPADCTSDPLYQQYAAEAERHEQLAEDYRRQADGLSGCTDGPCTPEAQSQLEDAGSRITQADSDINQADAAIAGIDAQLADPSLDQATRDALLADRAWWEAELTRAQQARADAQADWNYWQAEADRIGRESDRLRALVTQELDEANNWRRRAEALCAGS